MTYGATIVGMLNDNDDLVELLTGGIHEFQDSGRKGLNRIELMQAFQQKTGLLKPTCIIYEAEERPTLEAISPSTGYMSTVTPVFGWIYDDGDAGYDTIDQANTLIYETLNFARISGGFQIHWDSTLKNKREALLSNAAYYSFGMKVYGFRRNS